MKADPEAQIRLLDLQQLDTTLDQLSRRRAGLPEHAEVENLQQRLSELGAAVVLAETEAGDSRREQTKAENDVDQVRARADRDQRRLDSGQVSSPKELESLQSEISSLHRRQSDLEDVVLEIMERREEADTRVESLSSERSEVATGLADAEERRDAALRGIDDESANVRERHSAVAGEIPSDLLSLYEKLRGQYAGVGAAALAKGRCQGCHLALNKADLARIREADPDEVLRCEECRRILVRTPESGL